MNETIKFPFYAKLACTLVSLIAIFYIIHLGQSIIFPFLIALLFSILLSPVIKFLKTKLKFPHILAVMTAVVLFVLLILGILTFISFQISDFVTDIGKIKENINIHLTNIQEFVQQKFNLSKSEQKQYIEEAKGTSIESGKSMIGSTLLSFSDMLGTAVIIPIYMFLILLYKTHFIKFFAKLINTKYHDKLQEILEQVKGAVNSYLVGLCLQLISVSALTTVGLMIVGVKYAVLLGIITGLLNLIPYVGILVAYVISIMATLTGTPDLNIIIGVIIVNVVVQLIDNNILVPMVVSSKVEVNALVSIIGIIIGGSLGGVAGMFLAIPYIAILKVIFDRIEPLEPWGYLMGDDLPKSYEWKKIKFMRYNYDESTHDIYPFNKNLIVPVEEVILKIEEDKDPKKDDEDKSS